MRLDGLWIQASLVLAYNSLVNTGRPEARLVPVRTDRVAGHALVRMTDNVFVGAGQVDLSPVWGGGGNRRLALDAFGPTLR